MSSLFKCCNRSTVGCGTESNGNCCILLPPTAGTLKKQMERTYSKRITEDNLATYLLLQKRQTEFLAVRYRRKAAPCKISQRIHLEIRDKGTAGLEHEETRAKRPYKVRKLSIEPRFQWLDSRKSQNDVRK